MNPESTPVRDSRFGTLANAVTLTRVMAAPLLVAAILADARIGALGLFALAVATDVADGRLARRLGEASPLGGLLDHGADALFCSLGLAALAWTGVLPMPLPFLVAVAFFQYVLDSRSIEGLPLRVSFLGRWNGIFYFVLIGIPVVRDALALTWPSAGLLLGLGWVLVASTLLSMIDRGLAAVRSTR